MHNIEVHFFDFINLFVKKTSRPNVSKQIIVNHHHVKIDNLPNEFTGFKILHISDLHGINFLNEFPKFYNIIKKEKPNILVVSGDISHDGYYVKCLEFFDQISDIIPHNHMFVVTGNHEFLTCKHHKVINITEVSQEFIKRGINFLRNQTYTYRIENQKISIVGVDDPWDCKNEFNYMNWHLESLAENIPKNRVKILLSHRPEFFSLYQKYHYDLTFSGHTHGGQIFIPLINRGLYSPGQGFFSKHTRGHYHKNKCHLIISAGIGNETTFPRINNPGDINFVTLTK